MGKKDMDSIIGQLKRHQAETKTRILTTGSTEKGWGAEKRKEARAMGLVALQQTKTFQSCSKATLKRLSRQFKPITFRSGEYVIKQGAIGLRFYVILSGQVSVYVKQDENRPDLCVAKLERGNMMGERSLLTSEKTSASCIATMETACVYLSRIEFEQCFGAEEIEDLVQLVRKQDLLSCGNTRDYSYMDTKMQDRVIERVRDFRNKFSKNKQTRRQSIMWRQKKVKMRWARVHTHVKTMLLMRLPCFRGLSYDVLQPIVSRFSLVKYKKRQYVYKKGERATHGFLIIGGTVGIRGIIIKKQRVVPAPLRTAVRGEDIGLYEMMGDVFEGAETLALPKFSKVLFDSDKAVEDPCWRRYYTARAGLNGALVLKFDKEACQSVWELYRRHLPNFDDSTWGLVRASINRRLGAKMFLAQRHPLLKDMSTGESAVLLDGNLCRVRELAPGTTIHEKGQHAELVTFIIAGEAMVNDMAAPPRALTMTDRMHGKLSNMPEKIDRRCASNIVTLGAGAVFGVEEVLGVVAEEIARGITKPMSVQEKLWRTKEYVPYSKGLVVGSMSTAVFEMDQTLLMGHATTDTLIRLRRDVILREHWRRQAVKNTKCTFGVQDTPFLQDLAEAHNVCGNQHCFGNYLDMLTSSLVRQDERDLPKLVAEGNEKSMHRKPAKGKYSAPLLERVPRPIAVFSNTVRSSREKKDDSDTISELSKTIWNQVKKGGVSSKDSPGRNRLHYRRGRKLKISESFLSLKMQKPFMDLNNDVRQTPHLTEPKDIQLISPQRPEQTTVAQSGSRPLGTVGKIRWREALEGSFNHQTKLTASHQFQSKSKTVIPSNKPLTPFTPIYFKL